MLKNGNTLRILIVFVLLALVVGGLFLWRQPASSATAQASLLPLLTEEDTAGFARATTPNNIEFPRDLGAHPDYQTEWWYYTGNLQTDAGRNFGYQFTIFRRAIEPAAKVASSPDWRTQQVYFAHFTVSDVENETFYPQERFSRGAAGLAGAEAAPYRVWIEDWAIGGDRDQVHLSAKGDQVEIDLNLEQTRPPVLQGDRGLSVKGPEPGNASYYYSIVQQPTQGTVTIGDKTLNVTGTSWTDHEYSTSALSPGTAGWDWFSLQFDDQTALMIYALRQQDGTPSEFSKGTFIDRDGTINTLNQEDWHLDVLSHWKSPQSKAIYPSAWKISIPKLDLTVQGEPFMANQELNLSTVYWEGAVHFSGTHQNQSINAKGYTELTGYKEALTSLS